MTIAFVFLTSALAMAEFKIGPVTIGFSSLLTCMMLGTLFCNLCPLSGEIMEKGRPVDESAVRRRSSSSPAQGWIWACSKTV